MPHYSIGELALRINGEVHGEADQKISGLASLSRAQSHQLAYFDNPVRHQLLKNTGAGAVLLQRSALELCPVNAIVVANPFLAMSTLTGYFHKQSTAYSHIHPTAQISPTAELGENVSIGAHTLIGEGVVIGAGTQIGAHCVIEKNTWLGEGCRLRHKVVVHEGVQIGTAARIDSSAVLGATPFNPIKSHGKWVDGPDIGGLVIGNTCSIGAHTVIDRGSVSDTWVGDGVHMDNLIQLGHDVVIGAYTAIAGCACVGAHSTIGQHCVIGGGAAIAANVHLVDEVIITGMSVVHKSLKKPGVYSSGMMIAEHKRWRKNAARVQQLDVHIQRLKKLEKQSSDWFK